MRTLAACISIALTATLFAPVGPAGAVAGFGDVPADAFYTSPVQWMVDEEITRGTSPGCFSPDRAVTRGEVATFLWRFAGEPFGGSEPFADVGPEDFFGSAVAWMARKEITRGTSATTFSPDRAVTRGEVATFLWRFDGSPSVEVDPGGLCGSETTTTTVPPPPPPGSGDRFETLPPGSELPSGAECAVRVRPAAETRSGNVPYNQTRGSGPHPELSRVDGDFTGTTDEILQWVACKWGFDEDVVRAQVAKESWWDQETGGDLTSDTSACHPDFRHLSPCPESIGILQVRYLYHTPAMNDSIASTAYNADYTYGALRSCYEGNETWLNQFERGGVYAAGDLWGCLGVWFSGRWRTERALGYIDAVEDLLAQRVWEQPYFPD